MELRFRMDQTRRRSSGMSHRNHPGSRQDASRPRRRVRALKVESLEERKLPAPIVATGFQTATFTAAAVPTNANLGTVTISETAGTGPAPLTSVAQLTSANSFGG